MIFLTYFISIVLTTAQYVECFNTQDCWDYYEKKYCYAGLCTDMCPPGYSQKNEGSEPFFSCHCNKTAGFHEDGIFTVVGGHDFTSYSISKCKCVKDFCVATVYATGVGYTDGLITKGRPPNCKVDTDEIPPVLSEFIFYLVIGIMIVFLFINCRSSSHVIYDFYRYIALYILASIAVIVFVQTVYPFSSGFTRSMAFGIMIHNSAEWNLLIRLHYGKTASPRVCANVCVMVYYLIMLGATAVLPLQILLLFSMIQGGFLDWTLVFFVVVVACKLEDEENPQPCMRKCCCCQTKRRSFICTFGVAAATHLFGVQVLFYGFILNSPSVIGVGAGFLVPMFLIYTLWAIGQDRVVFVCGPTLFMNYEKRVGETPDFQLVPFMHTTQLVDVCWQKFIGDSLSKNLRDEDESELDVLVDGGKVDNSVVVIENAPTNIQIEDPESFKFGIDEEVKHCCCGGWLFTWIPLYWLAAFIFIIINASCLFFIPKAEKLGCDTGYKYGVW